MDVFVTDLHKDTARIRQEISRQLKSVAEVTQVGMDAELPSIAERADLLGFSSGILEIAVPHVPLVRARLPV